MTLDKTKLRQAAEAAKGAPGRRYQRDIFISLATPDTILQLLDELETARPKVPFKLHGDYFE